MGEMLRQCLPFVLPGLLPVLALLHVPLVRRRGRIAWAALLGTIAVLFLVDLAVLDHSGTSTLRVTTFFGGDDGEPRAMVVDEVTAPHWHWHVAASVWFAVVAVYAWLVRDGAPGPRWPVGVAVAAFAWALVGRLALEKTAAPAEIVWAVGVTAASFAIMPFFGWYCGRRGLSFGGFAVLWLLANVLQRLVLVAVAWVATTRALGTHLDVHGIPAITVPLRGRIELRDADAAWLHAMAMPQLTFALAMTFVIGLLLGGLAWRIARRRAARGSGAPAA